METVDRAALPPPTDNEVTTDDARPAMATAPIEGSGRAARRSDDASRMPATMKNLRWNGAATCGVNTKDD